MAYRFTDPSAFPYQSGALFLGLDPATGHEVGITAESHAITVARARTGKGAAVLIPNARRWPESLLVIDPKGENVAASWEAREAMGQAVHVIDPFKIADIPDRLRASFNPLAAIDHDSVSAREDVKVLADGMVRRVNPKNAEWDNGARDILAGAMAYVMLNNPPEKRTLTAARDMLIQPKEIADDAGNLIGGLYYHAQMMVNAGNGDGLSKLARAAGITITDALENGKGMPPQLLDAARRHSEWLDSDPIAAALSASSFNLAAIKSGKVSVFLVLPAGYVETHGAFLRLFVRSAIYAMERAGANTKGRCLFLLDEFFQLGRVDEIAKSMGLMPGYGVHLWPFLQDLGQLHELYGAAGSKTFFANADVHMFFGIDQDADACKLVSDRIGPLEPDEISRASPTSTYVERAAGPSPSATPFDIGRRKGAGPFSAGESPSDYARRLASDDAGARASHDARDENARRKAAKADADARAAYDHAMKKVGTPRLPPAEIAQISGKGQADKVARSMIVFGPSGVVLNLHLAPYFTSVSDTPARAPASSLDLADLPAVDFAKSYWLTGGGFPEKIAMGAIAFMVAAGFLGLLAPPPLVFWPLVIGAAIFTPPMLTGRVGVNWVYVALFAFGFMAAMTRAEPLPAFVDYPRAVEALFQAIMFAALGKLVMWVWQALRTS